MQTLRARRGSSFREGGCNFCDTHMTPAGEAHHTIWLISGRSVQVRFCEDCLMELLAQTGKARRGK